MIVSIIVLIGIARSIEEIVAEAAAIVSKSIPDAQLQEMEDFVPDEEDIEEVRLLLEGAFSSLVGTQIAKVLDVAEEFEKLLQRVKEEAEGPPYSAA